ncbi:amino acid adenylation domain-containing protein [Streptomyces orinoci]|uniref:Amino acid adenylation domain-containing protein n=1 Tax=Streptomyces orinoci TaxID=67339 RepID=A0ABV3JYZ5_STRON|nr:amino acid adenylation domain-containing protein [Streptomyces orinoci]
MTTASIVHGPALDPVGWDDVLARYTHQVARDPSAPAVEDGELSWSYGELDALADATAEALRDAVRPGELVGVCLDRSVALVATAVALARLGAVYLPLGPRPGERRLATVTGRLKVSCLIGAPEVLPAAYRPRGGPLPLPAAGANAGTAPVAAFPAAAPDAADRAKAPEGTFYAVLTSGSTGEPKAVAVSGTALAARLRWYAERTGLGPGDRHSLLVGVSFDPHLMELWATLTCGGTLAVAPDEVRWDPDVLTGWWHHAGVTTAIAPTPLAELVLERPWPRGLPLRHLQIGGDRLRRRPSPEVTAAVDNAYGPAEATVLVTAQPLADTDPAGLPPIGLPVSGVTVCVTDADGRVVPRGTEGELRVGGAGLALGYLDPELTARRFVAPPPELTGIDCVYRTGDRVRMRADGVLEFLGRLDDQVKIRGVRIEPAEVEAAFEHDPRVRRAAVAVDSSTGGARLIAFIRPAAPAPSADALLTAARDWLPEQAVPAAVRFVADFPLDANGKVDRAALLAGHAGTAAGAQQGAAAPPQALGAHDSADAELAGNMAPESRRTPDTEELVLGQCRRLLGRPDLGPDDNFLASGGDSLTAARLLTALEEASGVRLRAPEVLRQPDLRSLAALLDSRAPGDRAGSVTAANPGAIVSPGEDAATAATTGPSSADGPAKIVAPGESSDPNERTGSTATTGRRKAVDASEATGQFMTDGLGRATAPTLAHAKADARPKPGNQPEPENQPAPGVLAQVLRHAAVTPAALAVFDGEQALTYRELTEAAGQLAVALRVRGVAPGTAVGLLLPHSPALIVAQLAVWWAGGHYVPLDAAYPRPRTEAMLADAGVTLTVGEKDALEALGIPPARALAVSAAGVAQDGPYLAEALPAIPAYDPRALAYVMFTSGSTGRPKAVGITHQGVAGLTIDPDYLTLGPRDRVLFHSPLTFDAAPFECWAALANGAAVVISTADRRSLDSLARDIERLGATTAVFTTALFHTLAARSSAVFAVLRTVIVGGEALSARHARAVLREHPWLELINGYGPAEATTFATCHRVTDADCDAPPPIGRPVAGASAHVLDEHGEQLPPGTRGELCLGGGRLATGYLNQPELTAERFFEHPTLGRLYRTGDLASARPDGVLDFHGRLDDQIKVRGFRIEPGEIEHALRTHPGVADAAVTVLPPDARLTAFVVPAEGTRPIAAGLREHLAGRLPAHLLPGAWSFTERLPLTANGKVDRAALAGLPLDEATSSAPSSAPAAGLTPIQQVVAEAWGRALQCEVDDPEADFLALGGHSLLALGVVDDLREDLGVELTLAAFFSAPTVAGQATLIERELLGAEEER